MTRVPCRESNELAPLPFRCEDHGLNDDFVRALISPNLQFSSDDFDPRRFIVTPPPSLAFNIPRSGILHLQSHPSKRYPAN